MGIQNAFSTCIILQKRIQNDILECSATKVALIIPVFQHFPPHNENHFGKCDFRDLWEEVWKGRAEGSQWHRKSVFVMLKCVGVFTWAVCRGKWTKMFANHFRQKLNDSIKEPITFMKQIWHLQTILGWDDRKQLLTPKVQSIKERSDIGLHQNKRVLLYKRHKKMKSKPQIGRKYFLITYGTRELYPEYIKVLKTR